ncbi:MAG TPA: hypothetical protein P5268_07330 [Candidatus Marinimicrobia bacterium]|nr:hypothetical protein [Candidatus Neomarinimicrobiota bacterium]HRS51096.1 hypothetical protein [Candidatus Neomarinimicrobiota bacterium]HRU92825.1 hypothetical protein [Candidatus Neomarinimicrobiota bacterium]
MLKRSLICLSLGIGIAQAAFEIHQASPVIIAGGGTISVLPDGSNPATLIEKSGLSTSCDYSNLYGIKNLQIWEIGLFYNHHSKTGFALRLSTLGNPVYQEKTIGFSCARRILPLISLGATVNYYDLTISNYPRTGTVGLNCGLKLFPDSTLGFAILFENINAPKICDRQEPLPQVFAFGWQWKPIRRGDLSGEIFKDTRFPFTWRSGIRFEVFTGCNLLAGVQFNPDRFSGGLELSWHKFQIALAFLHHPTLPYTVYYQCGLNF